MPRWMAAEIKKIQCDYFAIDKAAKKAKGKLLKKVSAQTQSGRKRRGDFGRLNCTVRKYLTAREIEKLMDHMPASTAATDIGETGDHDPGRLFPLSRHRRAFAGAVEFRMRCGRFIFYLFCRDFSDGLVLSTSRTSRNV